MENERKMAEIEAEARYHREYEQRKDEYIQYILQNLPPSTLPLSSPLTPSSSLSSSSFPSNSFSSSSSPSDVTPSSSIRSRRHTFLIRTLLTQHWTSEDHSYYAEICRTIRLTRDKADFVLIILIRLLYIKNDYFNHIRNVLQEFSFWPTSNHFNITKHMPDVIFWSENHTFMYLSSAYLYYQAVRKLPNFNPAAYGVTEKDMRHLLAYLDGHLNEKFNGVYEVLSSTYLPYTLCSLFNLYDFAEDHTVRDKSKQLIDLIVCSFTLVTNRSGVCNLTASARQYPHSRLNKSGHNIHQLIFFLTGERVDEDFKPTSIVDFVLTTSWRPPIQALINFMLPESLQPSGTLLSSIEVSIEGSLNPNGGHWSERLKMNHKTKEIEEIYSSHISPTNAIPFHWSAGLVTHPKFIDCTLKYQQKYHLLKNPGIAHLTAVPTPLAKTVMRANNHFSKGQNYTNIYLNVYKSPTRKVVMTSFDEYNVSYHAYQQMPWMVNFDGVGIWSQSGKDLFGQRCTNISSPSIKQYHNILLVVYCIHNTVTTDSSIQLVWPSDKFEFQQRQKESDWSYEASSGGTYPPGWWFGTSNSCHVGVYCNTSTVEDQTSRDDFKMEMDPQTQEEKIVLRRKSEGKLVYFLVVVGDCGTHESFQTFLDYCLSLEHTERKNREYSVRVNVPNDSWSLETSIDTDTMRIRI